MSMIKIVCRFSGKTFWEGEAQTVREAVLKAIKEGANLGGADLGGAYLRGADLGGADLGEIKKDFESVLTPAKPEVPGLWKALHDGKVDGSTYTGECACLVGTIANVKGVSYEAIPGLKPDASRPAEKWFLAIRKGDTPENNHVSAIVRDWIKEFAEKNGIALPTRKVIWE